METTSLLTDHPQENGEIELVLGQRQVASVLFVAIVVIALFSTIAYVVGRGAGSGTVHAANRPVDAVSLPVIAIPQPARAPETSVAMVPVVKPSAAAPATAPAADKSSAFPEKIAIRSGLGPAEPAPKPGEIYIQVGAVERGFAEIVVAGLRVRGYASVMAPSSSEKIFRVLIGPLQDAEAFARTKAELEAAGLNFFARRYVVEATTASANPVSTVQTTTAVRTVAPVQATAAAANTPQ